MFIGSSAGLAGALLASAALAACGASAPESHPSARKPTPGSPRFPVSVHGAGGTATIASYPDRIVSLSPTSTEDLYAIGAGPQVVAVDSYSNYPADAPHTELSAYEPNVEAIAAYNPDLVVISDESPTDLAPALRKLHIPVLLDPAAHSLSQAYAEIAELGLATGHLPQARALASSMKDRIAQIVHDADDEGHGLTVYDEIEQDYYAATSSTFAGQLLALFGLKDIADQAPDPQGLGYPQLSAEYLVTSNPDIVLLTDSSCCHQNAAAVSRRPGWSEMTAVQKHTIYPLNEDIASRWGPRTVELASEIAHAVEGAHGAGLHGVSSSPPVPVPFQGELASRVEVAHDGGLRWWWGLAGALALLGALLGGLAVGPAPIGPGAIVSDIASLVPGLGIGHRLDPLDGAVLWQIRAPRVVLGAIVGATLASAGAGYQAVFRNPLADPYLLGVAAGAGLGATAAIAGGSPGLLAPAAFAGAAGAVLITYGLGRSLSGRDPSTLILAGVAVAAFLTAAQTFILQEHSQSVQAVYSWLLGRLDVSGWSDVTLALPYAAVSVAVLLAHRRLLDVLRLGDEEAQALGVNVARVRLTVVIASTLGTAAVVAVSGLIGFVGIVLPHAVRLLVGASYRVIMPLAAAFGAAFLVLADIVARTVLSPAEVPIGVVTACVGAPVFALVLRATRSELL